MRKTTKKAPTEPAKRTWATVRAWWRVVCLKHSSSAASSRECATDCASGEGSDALKRSGGKAQCRATGERKKRREGRGWEKRKEKMGDG
eukprot:77421-Rhodomonas_salina.1